jgi:biopolymer transport protein ExbB
MIGALGTNKFLPIIGLCFALLIVSEVVQVFAPSLQSVAVAQEEAAADAPAEKPKENMLMWTYKALGIRYTVAFLAISFAFVALVIMNFLSIRYDNFVPQHLVDSFEALVNEKKYQDAYELVKTDESFLGQMLSSGLSRLSRGYEHAVAGMQEVGDEENMKLEHRLSYVAMIGTLAPMVGLLGTVDGMIASFAVIANSPITPKPSQLAEGIATALVTTLVGLLIAIPAIAVFNILKNRVAQLVLKAGVTGENLMNRFENMAPAKK